jgi:hypothetical protein
VISSFRPLWHGNQASRDKNQVSTNSYKRVGKNEGFSKYIVHCPKEIILKLA